MLHEAAQMRFVKLPHTAVFGKARVPFACERSGPARHLRRGRIGDSTIRRRLLDSGRHVTALPPCGVELEALRKHAGGRDGVIAV